MKHSKKKKKKNRLSAAPKVHNNTKHVSFGLTTSSDTKTRTKKPHKDIHIYKFEVKTVKKKYI